MKKSNIFLGLLSLFLFSCSSGDDGNEPIVAVVPAAPAQLNAILTGTDQVTLNWTDNSINEDGFKIERSAEQGNFSEIASVGTDISSFIDNSLELSTAYSYRVRAFNNAGNSSYSNQVSITTPDPMPPSNLLYALKSNGLSSTETTKFVSIDPTNGNETNLLDFNTTDNFESTAINRVTNQIYFITSLFDGNVDTEIFTIDAANNTFSVVNLNDDPEIDYELVPTSNGTLYAIKQSYVSNIETSKLVSIDPSNGNDVVLLDLETTDNFNSLVFDDQENKIYGVTSIGDGNTDCELYSIDLINNSYSIVPFSSQYKYELAITNNGTLYGIEQTFGNDYMAKLFSINPSTGAKSLIIDLQTVESFNNIIVNEDKLFGVTQLDFPNEDIEIYSIDIQNNSFSFEPLNDIPGVSYELINGI